MKFFLSIILIVLASCDRILTSDSKSQLELKFESEKLDIFFKKYDNSSQVFKVSSQIPSKIRGKNGTIVSIHPEDLITENGEALEKEIEIELKELLDTRQLFRANAQTISNERLLVSGGVYYINLTSNEKILKLKTGKTLTVEFPRSTSKAVSLFYGMRDPLGKLAWDSTGQKLENKIRTVKVSQNQSADDIDDFFQFIDRESDKLISKRRRGGSSTIVEKLYKPIEIRQLGWVSCGSFYDASLSTNLKYVFNKKDKVEYARVFLVFSDINSIVQNHYSGTIESKGDWEFKGIPLGANVRIIAMAIKNGEEYTCVKEMKIKENETVELILSKKTGK
ncbi:MAG: hypothetical protein ACRCVT_12245 [Leadbetterella sp.]